MMKWNIELLGWVWNAVGDLMNWWFDSKKGGSWSHADEEKEGVSVDFWDSISFASIPRYLIYKIVCLVMPHGLQRCARNRHIEAADEGENEGCERVLTSEVSYQIDALMKEKWFMLASAF